MSGTQKARLTNCHMQDRGPRENVCVPIDAEEGVMRLLDEKLWTLRVEGGLEDV